MPPRSHSAVSTAHSSACEEERPAPTGTSEWIDSRAPGTSYPYSRSAQTTPATYPPQSPTPPGYSSSGPNTTVEPGCCAESTVHRGLSTTDASTKVRNGNANGR